MLIYRTKITSRRLFEERVKKVKVRFCTTNVYSTRTSPVYLFSLIPFPITDFLDQEKFTIFIPVSQRTSSGV